MMKSNKNTIPSRGSESVLLENWKQGPIGDKPLLPGHDRGIFSMSTLGDTLVTASADHGLRVYNLRTGNFERELFGKKYGHKEWVTTCKHLKDGRVLSGGMDSMLCLWDAKGVRCDFISGHNGSISKVIVDEYNIGISASYDCTLMIWDLDTKGNAMRLAGPHKSPILDFEWNNSLVVSGDKEGYVSFWDVNKGIAFKTYHSHRGAVSNVAFYSDAIKHNYIITTGITDGCLCFHDMRTNKTVFHEQIHKGAINAVKTNLSGLVITVSADKTGSLIDIQSGFKKFGTIKGSDALYSLELIHNLSVVGSGDGNILLYDNDTLECLWGYGVMNKGGVRCLKITDDNTRLVAAGDDPNAMLLYFI